MNTKFYFIKDSEEQRYSIMYLAKLISLLRIEDIFIGIYHDEDTDRYQLWTDEHF